MISLRNIESLISFITLAIAYIIGATIAGYVQAWTAKKMGDNTGADAGFLTLNPLAHVDPVGTFFLLYIGIGWGKQVPINPANIEGYARLAIAYFSAVFSYLFVALTSFVILIYIFGVRMMQIALEIIKTGHISLQKLSYVYPGSSSFMLVIALILVVMVYLSILFAIFDFFIESSRFISTVFFPSLETTDGAFITMFVAVTFMILFAAGWHALLVDIISKTAYHIAQMLGAA